MKAAVRLRIATFFPRFALRWLELDRSELGLAGEALAARALLRAGWRLVGRRVRTPLAEVDLVAEAPGLLVCVEVKTSRVRGSVSRWRPGVRLDARTLARQRGAARWLAARSGADRARVDLVEVEVWDAPLRIRIRHTVDLSRVVD